MRRSIPLLLAVSLGLPFATATAGSVSVDIPLVGDAPRDAAAVVLTGKQLAAFSAPAPMPVRVLMTDQEDLTQVTPPDSSNGANVAVDTIAVFAADGSGVREIPAQVDERFWRYLENLGGENGAYSGIDPELTYVFDDEGYRKTGGTCFAEYPAGQPITTPDPVQGLDDDDEVAFMARDTGARVTDTATIAAGQVYEITVADPVTDAVTYAYVASIAPEDHAALASYVSYELDEDANFYIGARGGQGIPEGPRCKSPSDLTTASTGARRPTDKATFRSAQYEFHWGGRWIPDQIRIANDSGYGVDLIDQWKGRAFQLTREQAVSVGFIGDKAWEETSVTLGTRVGPIRVIRETWGAKSGTNVTRIYTLYDRVYFDTFFLRVHPIPPDGIYSMWDHNKDSVQTYYSMAAPSGVPIDGVNDEVFGNIDVGTGTPAESHYDIADPTVQSFTPVEFWEQVAGDDGSIVYYMREDRPGPGVLTSYYRDDADFDDGSGDNPAAKQGSFGAHGVHFYATGDTDNIPLGFPVNEMEVTQSQYMVRGNPGNVGESYATAERLPLQVSSVLR